MGDKQQKRGTRSTGSASRHLHFPLCQPPTLALLGRTRGARGDLLIPQFFGKREKKLIFLSFLNFIYFWERWREGETGWAGCCHSLGPFFEANIFTDVLDRGDAAFFFLLLLSGAKWRHADVLHEMGFRVLVRDLKDRELPFETSRARTTILKRLVQILSLSLQINSLIDLRRNV